MERKFRVKSKNSSIIFCIAIGVGVGMIMSILLAITVAMLISNEALSESFIRYAGICIMVISSFISVQIGGRFATEKKLLVGVCSAAAYYLLLASLTILFFGGRFSGIGAGTIAFLIGCGSSTLLLGMPARKGLKRRSRVFSR